MLGVVICSVPLATGGALTQMVNGCSAVWPPASPAFTSTVNGPPWLAWVGVPAMVPFDDRDKPSGRLPLAIDQKYSCSPAFLYSAASSPGPDASRLSP